MPPSALALNLNASSSLGTVPLSSRGTIAKDVYDMKDSVEDSVEDAQTQRMEQRIGRQKKPERRAVRATERGRSVWARLGLVVW